MPETSLGAFYDLDDETIDRIVTSKSAGAYCLGPLNADTGNFVPKYVGRSDDDIKARLKNWSGKYPKFKFKYYSTAKAAYEKECRLYHDWLKQLDNEIHPAKPEGSDWKCPVCGE